MVNNLLLVAYSWIGCLSGGNNERPVQRAFPVGGGVVAPGSKSLSGGKWGGSDATQPRGVNMDGRNGIDQGTIDRIRRK